MPEELTWREAIDEVLSEAPGAMHYRDITDKIIEDGLHTSLGATPTATVNAQLGIAIRSEEDRCPFQKVGVGLYKWKENAELAQKPVASSEEPDEDDEVQYDVVSSFGMFWQRDAIDWVWTPKILGIQKKNAQSVDFYGQVGIYLLYDGREVIYVGRATKLGLRLREHTADRLSARWNRFSWFGLLPVSEAGILGSLPESYLGTKIIPALEAILIEALEPRQNRMRGDDLSVVEYIQKEGPEIQKKKALQSLEAILNKR